MAMGVGWLELAMLWLFGVVTVVAIWVGVWWLLTAIGLTARRGRPAPSPAVGQPGPHPVPSVPAESDHR